MASGLPKSIIKKYGISKKAWRVYRSGRSSTRRRSPTRNKKVRNLPRRRSKRRRRGPRTIPILPLAGVAATFLPAIEHVKVGDFEGAVRQAVESTTGFSIADNQWYPDRMLKGLTPLVVSIAAHKVLNMIGANRVFSRLPSPLNKLRL